MPPPPATHSFPCTSGAPWCAASCCARATRSRWTTTSLVRSRALRRQAYPNRHANASSMPGRTSSGRRLPAGRSLLIYATTLGHIAALDLATGRLAWSLQPPASLGALRTAAYREGVGRGRVGPRRITNATDVCTPQGSPRRRLRSRPVRQARSPALSWTAAGCGCWRRQTGAGLPATTFGLGCSCARGRSRRSSTSTSWRCIRYGGHPLGRRRHFLGHSLLVAGPGRIIARAACAGGGGHEQVNTSPDRECVLAATAGGNIVMLWDIASSTCDLVLGVRDRDVRSWYSRHLHVRPRAPGREELRQAETHSRWRSSVSTRCWRDRGRSPPPPRHLFAPWTSADAVWAA